MKAHLLWTAALALAAVACWQDWKSRRVPNRLTVPALVAGLVANGIFGGWAGLWAALTGAGLALAILLPVVLLRGLGAGDWKLMGALGAWLGPQLILRVLFTAVLIAGAWAVIEMIRQRRVGQTLRNLWELVRGFVVFGLRPHPSLTIENPGLIRLPFAVAVAAATVISVSVAW